MLKHNPKLRKAWNKAKWRKDKDGNLTLDKKYKSSKEFEKAMQNKLIEDVKGINPDEREVLDYLFDHPL